MATTVQLILLTVVLMYCVQAGITQCDAVRISAAVLQVLQPFVDETRAGLEAVKRDLESMSSLAGELEKISEKVYNLTESVEMHTSIDWLAQISAKMDAVDSKLVSVSAAMNRVNLTVVQNQVEEHNNHVSSTLVELQTKQSTIDTKLDLLDSKQDALVVSEKKVLRNVTKQLLKTYDFFHDQECGGTGGWRRVAQLDMTDPNSTCPSGWKLTGHSKRTCGKVSTNVLTCDSVFFPVNGAAYTRVCGTIKAYQYQYTSAFKAYRDGVAMTINDAYVSGVSLTHGNPRQHIWTFAAGISELYSYSEWSCPCDATIDIPIPPFVGNDYFCESGVNSQTASGFHPDDPLWDGKNCTSSSRCCSFSNPPYFSKWLSSATTDDIEVRQCQWSPIMQAPIEFIELFVKLDEVEAINELESNVLTNVKEVLQNIFQYDCGDTGGWRRVVYLDMTVPNTTCPSGWQLTEHSKKTCGRAKAGSLICDSVIFPVGGGAYTSVCGRIRAYQDGITDAFEAYDEGKANTIDDAYVSGVSLTHGSPRQHIWTFAAGSAENYATRNDACPCDAALDPPIAIPSFVDEDYFCESGANLRRSYEFHSDDPLWDGEGCISSSACCSLNNPPYFTKQLPYATSDDIEARICQKSSVDDTPIEFIELYVK